MEIIKDKDLGLTPLDERVAALERGKGDRCPDQGSFGELLDLKESRCHETVRQAKRARAEMRMAKPGTGGQGQGLLSSRPKTARPQRCEACPEPFATGPAARNREDGHDNAAGHYSSPEKRKNSDYIIASAGFSKAGCAGFWEEERAHRCRGRRE